MARAVRFPASRELENGASPRAEDIARASTALGARVGGLKQVLGRAPELKDVRRNLAEAFESEFEVELSEGDLNLSEHDRYLRAASEMASAGWIDLVSRPASGMPLLEALHAFRGKVLRVQLRYEIGTRTIRQVWFSGDIAWNPRRSLLDFEAALRDVPMERLEREVQSFFASHAVDRGPLELRDLVDAVRLAAQQRLTA
jgi:lipoate---protein ligase